jgi:hypothetical protein
LKGRTGWLILLGFVVVFVAVWDIAAARTNGESLTYTFRRNVAETAWRWPVLLFLVLLLAHLFMPPSLRQYDPIDRLYKRFNPAYQEDSGPIPEDPATDPTTQSPP